MLGHDHVADDHEPVVLSRFLQDQQEKDHGCPLVRAWANDDSNSGDEMEVPRSVVAL